jgi:hypothetical protein
MKGYKELKAKSKLTLRKKKVIDHAEVREITDEQQKIIRQHQQERSHQELQLVSKRFDPATGEILEDQVQAVNIESIKGQLKSKQEEKARVDLEVADLESFLEDINKINHTAGGK